MLSLKNVSFGYRRGFEVISGITLDIPVGRTVLLGPNGAGKSTLLKVVAGVTSFSGVISLDGNPVKPTRRSRNYRKAVGWLPQDVRPFPGLTLREHVAYVGWLKGMSRASAWEEALIALRLVALENRAQERAVELSGGQTRRLGVAATLVHNARFLLLDEPTAGLDPRERDRFVDVLGPIEKTRAVLVSTHDTEAIVGPESRVVVLNVGKVKFNGTFEEFGENFRSIPEHLRVRAAYASFVPED
ncbi:MAG: ATP-binding cassette domain-containing protein [Microbacteriaceae bacterium]